MIITVSGTVVEKLDHSLVVETGGIGYQVWVTRQDFEHTPAGEDARYWVYESIREDAHELYGFTQPLGRELFERLLGVSGVGPKAALAILSIAGVEQAKSAISTGDVAFLQSATGVGKRTAERIAVELKDTLESIDSLGTFRDSGDDTAVQALESLGYTRSVALQALANIASDLDEESRIKQALRELS